MKIPGQLTETENDKPTQTVIDVVPVICVTTIYVKLIVSEPYDNLRLFFPNLSCDII